MSIRRSLTLALSAGLLAVAPLAMVPAAQAAVAKPLDVVSINYDPAGKDNRANAHINRETVVLKNRGTKTLNVTGYRIKDAANHTFVFPRGSTIRPGQSVTIHSGKGTNTAAHKYWKQGNYVWNNTGDALRLTNAKGGLLEKCSYRGGGSSVSC